MFFTTISHSQVKATNLFCAYLPCRTVPAVQQAVEQLFSVDGPSLHAPSLEILAVSSVDLSDVPEGTLGEWLCKHTMMIFIDYNNFDFTHLHADIDSHLSLLMGVLTDIAYQWEHLGTLLGLKYGKLKEIKKTKVGIRTDLMREMLAAWLQGQGGECSKQALKTALQKIGCSF